MVDDLNSYTDIISTMNEVAVESYTTAIIPMEEKAVKKRNNLILLIKRGFLNNLDKIIHRLFFRDSWFEKRVDSLYGIPLNLRNSVDYFTSVMIQIGEKVYERRYKFRPIDVLEMVTIQKLADDEKARRFFINELTEILKDTRVSINGELVTLEEYANKRGVGWDKAREHIAREVEKFFEAFRREMELYNNGGDVNRNLTIRGDRLAYYLHVRERLASGNDVWSKIIPLISSEIGFTVLLTIVGRRMGEAFGSYTTTKHATKGELLASLLGVHPEEDFEEIIKHGSWDVIEYHREKLNKQLVRISERLLGRHKLTREFKVNIPIVHSEVDRLSRLEGVRSKVKRDLTLPNS